MFGVVGASMVVASNLAIRVRMYLLTSDGEHSGKPRTTQAGICERSSVCMVNEVGAAEMEGLGCVSCACSAEAPHGQREATMHERARRGVKVVVRGESGGDGGLDAGSKGTARLRRTSSDQSGHAGSLGGEV